ncbi:alpha/beta fold hydrolase [Arenibacterium sp. CAU 1754]
MIALAIVIILGGAATYLRSRRRQRQAERAFPPEGQFVDVGGHQVHVVVQGSGPDLVLLHGASGNTRDMTFSLVEKLSPRYRVIVFDRPGLGHTPPLAANDVHLRDQVDLLVGASKSLGADRPIVAGQSFGGAVTMAWAVYHPENIAAAVSIAGATHPWPGKLDRLYGWLSRPRIGPVLAHLLSAWVSDGYIRKAVDEVFSPQKAPPGYADAIGTPLVLRPHSLLANAQQRHQLRQHLRDMVPGYDRITIPVEAVHGTSDSIVSHSIHSEALMRDIEGATLTLLPGIGHMPHHVTEDEVIAAIDAAAQRAGLR